MAPADQRFGTGDALGSQVELGLIEHAQLVAFHGLFQLAHQRKLLVERALLGLLVISEAFAVTRGLTRGMERLVGCVHVGDTEGKLDIDPVPTDFDRTAQDGCHAEQLALEFERFERGYPGECAIVDAVDRSFAARDAQPVLQAGEEVADRILADHQLHCVEFVDHRRDDTAPIVRRCGAFESAAIGHSALGIYEPRLLEVLADQNCPAQQCGGDQHDERRCNSDSQSKFGRSEMEQGKNQRGAQAELDEYAVPAPGGDDRIGEQSGQ